MPTAKTSPFVPLVALRRGKTVESVHYGAVTAADSAGKVLFSWGDSERPAFLRSSAKPFQAAAWLALGVDKRFGFDAEEIALAIGSHNAEEPHMRVLARMMKKAGVEASQLRCGARPSLHRLTREALRARNEEPTVLHNNCSGKHTGMLALTRHLGASLESYLEAEHPVQRAMLETVAAFCGVSPGDLAVAVDGCGVLTFAPSMRQGAMAFARLLDPAGLAPELGVAARSTCQAMRTHPFMVAGSESIDTDLMRACAGWNMVAKRGAEGYYALALMLEGRAVGVTVKVSDGDHADRARHFLVLEALNELGLPVEEMKELALYRERGIFNSNGTEVGRLERWKE